MVWLLPSTLKLASVKPNPLLPRAAGRGACRLPGPSSPVSSVPQQLGVELSDVSPQPNSQPSVTWAHWVSSNILTGSLVRSVDPSWPNRPVPQHHRRRSVSSAHEKFTPVCTADHSRSPGSGRGVVDPARGPPSCHASLPPQQLTDPPVERPHVCVQAGCSVSQPLPEPTRAGLTRIVVVPSPTWPLRLRPQQYAAPPVVTPQVCQPPALTSLQASPRVTFTGP